MATDAPCISWSLLDALLHHTIVRKGCAVVWCGVLQNSEVSRLQSQLQSAGGQRQQLEQQMSTLTQQMTSAMASLGQFMQQQVCPATTHSSV
jgi:hypothetical protein